MDTLSRCERKKTCFVIPVICDCCGHTQLIKFADRQEFLSLRCHHSQQPVFTAKGFSLVWREFQNDLMNGAVAV